MPAPAFQELADDLAEIFEAALAIEPPGGLPDQWRTILARYGFAPDLDDDEARYEEAVRIGLVRGAPGSPG